MSVLKLDGATGRLVMSWDAFESLSSSLIEKLRLLGRPFTGVYGFPRGGLVLAVKLSHALNVPLLMAPAKGCIVCDDISDTGETLLKYTKDYEYVTATLLMRHNTLAVPAFVGEYVSEPNWIEFPWEA